MNNKTPQIRFKDFTEPWEQCKLNEIAVITKGQQLNKSSLLSEGTYYVLNGGMTPSGYTELYNTNANTISISEGGNSCGFVAYNEENFWSGGHNYTLSHLKIDVKYLYQNLKKQESFIMSLRVGSGLPNVQKTRLSEVMIVYPKKTLEQYKIASFLMSIDNLITLHQRKFEALSNIKKALLGKMFPSNGEVTPKIRFAGFTEAWEKRKLGDESIEIIAGGDIERTKLVENGKYPIYANALTNDGLIGYYDHFYRVKAPAVTVTGRGEIGHATARNVDFTPIVRLLSVKSNHFNKFLECSINNHKVISESTGVPQLTVPQLSNYILGFPNDISEEIKIGSTFDKIDTLITLHQQKCEHLKNMKQSLLSKMFV